MPDSSSWNNKEKLDNEMCSVKSKCVQCIKDHGVKILSNVKFFYQCTKGTNKAKIILSFNNSFSYLNKDVILSLYNRLATYHSELSFGLLITQKLQN